MKRSSPIGRMEKEQLSMPRCLRLLDMGCRNIYFMDSEGRFTGEAMDRAAIRDAFLGKDGGRGWVACQQVGIGYIPRDGFEGLPKEAQREKLCEKLKEFPSQEEFPVVDGDGQILYVISKVEDAFHIDWERARFPEELRGFGKLYLSSLGHDNLLGFYMRYRTEMPMDVLTEGNFREALSGDGAIVYNEDFFPDCRKVSIVEAVRHQEDMERERARKAAEEARRIREEEEAKRREAEEMRRREEPSRKRAEELQGITDATAYFRALARHKEHYLVCVAVKDTFFQIPVETAKAMADLGMENLCRPGEQSRVYPQCWQGYLFVMDAGKVILNKLADAQISLFEEMEISGIDLQLVSRPYEYGNVAKIILDGRDLSTNARGLNVVVFDVGTRMVVDSVGFDFYHPDKGMKPCRRLPEGIGSTLPPRQTGAPRAIDKEVKRILPLVHIAKEWASIREDRLLDMSQLIEKFDEGYFGVSIVDSEGRFLRLVNRYQFAADFPKRDYRTQADLYAEYEEDEERLKWKLARMFLGTPRKEIPILRDGRIVGLGRKSVYFDLDGRWDPAQIYRFRWDWIDEGVAKEFFGGRRRVLISSDHGFLRGFREAFSKWLDIVVYEDCILGKCIAGDFDLMVCGADVFGTFPMEKWLAHQLYLMLLMETVRRWLSQRGVAFHFFSYDPGIPNLDAYVKPSKEMVGGTSLFVRDGEEPYIIADGNSYDRVLKPENRMPNYHSGRRVTWDAEVQNGGAIHFFGTCMAVGYASYSPDKSMESHLQRILNEEHSVYHVVNDATEGFVDYDVTGSATRAFNLLYRIMDTPFRLGDIAVAFAFGGYFWGRDSRFRPHAFHRIADIFSSEEHRKKLGLVNTGAGLAHMNVAGYEVMAKEIHRIVSADMLNHCNATSPPVSFFSRHSLGLRENSRIAEILDMFPKKVTTDLSIGSVLIHADIVTKGHIYLIQEAMKDCDFLYVFLLDFESRLCSVEQQKEILETCVNGSFSVLPCKSCHRLALGYLREFNLVIADPAYHFYYPVEDTYTFSRYIALSLGIKKVFVGKGSTNEFSRRYRILKREMLDESGIDWVEIPRITLEDGREIVTSQVRKLWAAEGWKACQDFLPEEACQSLRSQEHKQGNEI